MRLTLQEFVALDGLAIRNAASLADRMAADVQEAGKSSERIWSSIRENFQSPITAVGYDIYLKRELPQLLDFATHTQQLAQYLDIACFRFCDAIRAVQLVLDDCLANGFRVHNDWRLEDTFNEYQTNKHMRETRQYVHDVLVGQLTQSRQYFHRIDQEIAAKIFQFSYYNKNALSVTSLACSLVSDSEDDGPDPPNDHDGFIVSPYRNWPSLWGSGNNPQGSHIHQGQLGDCTVHATLAALADTDPALLKNSITEDPKHPGNYFVRLIHGSDGAIVPIYLTSAELMEHLKAEHIDPANEKALWPYVAEAAYVKYRNDYDIFTRHNLSLPKKLREALRDQSTDIHRIYDGDLAVHRGAYCADTLAAFTGKKSYTIFRGRWFWQNNDGDNAHEISARLHDKHHILIFSYSDDNHDKKERYFISSTGDCVHANHAYQVVAISGNIVTLRNPWGQIALDHPLPLVHVPLSELCDHGGNIEVGTI